MGPVIAANLSLAKGLASAEALATLSDITSDRALGRLCDCGAIQDDKVTPVPEVREEDVDDETEEGFSRAGQLRLSEIDPGPDHDRGDVLDDASQDNTEDDEREVEAMVLDGLEVEGENTVPECATGERMDCS